LWRGERKAGLLVVTTWEQNLIRQVQDGDRGAYAHLVRRYQGPIFHSVCRILADPDAAADVTQQAFVSAFENIHTYKPEYRFFSWLYRIAYNGAMNSIQRRRFRQPLADLDPPDGGPLPDARIESRERCGFVNEAIGTLEYKYRVLLVLRHYLNFSYAEIARIMDLPTTTVRSRMHTARVLLRDKLIAEGMGAAL
jgi:RNA polymerase sigma-70 factor (ECF subfamily)